MNSREINELVDRWLRGEITYSEMEREWWRLAAGQMDAESRRVVMITLIMLAVICVGIVYHRFLHDNLVPGIVEWIRDLFGQ